MMEYLKHMMAGMLTATVMLLVGVLLHSCEPARAETPDLQRAAEMAAQAEMMKVEAEYESMGTESKMDGVVYE
ncbi:hypothetical protein [Neisseria yangbaofengii]|uniref:hypothetical protein n=1 Tax=Neisseria yangbaofengii TaxID=2709396 RepID=UPI0013EC3602|nr:hypothetical protein [Neisseria yangbaofengii]